MAALEEVRLLVSADLPRVLELAGFAGWNQTLPDLERMLVFAPESCFGLWSGGQLVSTAMAFPYGKDLGWVAMVLTHPSERGKGYATLLTRQAIDWLREQETAWIKLDASPLGQPVYERLGFEAESRMERHLLSADAPRPARLPLPAEPLPLALDHAAFGADRRRLLDLLLRIPGQRWAVLPEGEGYAMLRPGARALQFGPVVCRTPSGAASLLQWALAESAGQPLQWDLDTRNAEALRLAQENGFSAHRVLTRMTLPGRPGPASFAGDAAMVYAIGGFDFG